jgi:dienelactone hydrolase
VTLIMTLHRMAMVFALVASLNGAAVAAPEWVRLESADADLTKGAATTLNAVVFRPEGKGPFPAVVALHGCGGLGSSKQGSKAEPISARHQDWGVRLAGLGFIVVMPDSFGSRGLESQCTNSSRTVLPGRERIRDAAGARLWLQALPDVDKTQVSLLGWSNGGSTVLYAVSRTAIKFPGPDFRKAVAFYPGCRTPAERGLISRLPLLILIGLADNWTPAAPCRDYAAKATAAGSTISFITYDNAYHDFDYPNLPIRERTGLAYTGDNSGRAFIGTDGPARADAIVRVPAFLKE